MPPGTVSPGIASGATRSSNPSANRSPAVEYVARPTVAPGAEQEPERAAALAEADVLQRRQLVDGGDEQRRARDPATASIPGQRIPCDAPASQREEEGEDTRGSPGREIAACE